MSEAPASQAGGAEADLNPPPASAAPTAASPAPSPSPAIKKTRSGGSSRSQSASFSMTDSPAMKGSRRDGAHQTHIESSDGVLAEQPPSKKTGVGFGDRIKGLFGTAKSGNKTKPWKNEGSTPQKDDKGPAKTG